MRVSEMLILVIISFGVLSAMLTFMGDLSQSYSITVPETLQNETAAYAQRVNQTASDIIETTQTEGGWVETAYNIFFKLPASLIGTVTSSLSVTMSFFSVTMGESQLITPDWFIIMISIIILVTFAFAALYFISGRRV